MPLRMGRFGAQRGRTGPHFAPRTHHLPPAAALGMSITRHATTCP